MPQCVCSFSECVCLSASQGPLGLLSRNKKLVDMNKCLRMSLFASGDLTQSPSLKDLSDACKGTGPLMMSQGEPVPQGPRAPADINTPQRSNDSGVLCDI